MKEKDYQGPAEALIDEISKMCEDWEKIDWNLVLPKCEDAIRQDPNCYPAYVLIGQYYSGELYSGVKDLDKMEEFYMKALSVCDKPWNIWTYDGVILFLDDGLKENERLARYLKKFIKKESKFTFIHYLIRTYKKLKDKEGALSALNEHLNRHPEDKKSIKLRKKVEKWKI